MILLLQVHFVLLLLLLLLLVFLVQQQQINVVSSFSSSTFTTEISSSLSLLVNTSIINNKNKKKETTTATPFCSFFSCYQYSRSISSNSRNLMTVVHYASTNKEGEEDQDVEGSSSDNTNISWLKDAVGIEEEDEQQQSLPRTVLPLEEGLSGFAVDPNIGFVAILASSSDKEEPQKATYVVISPNDCNRVSSPEALCLIQLAGGLDLGTAILPPDILSQLAMDEIDNDTLLTLQQLRKRLSLVSIDVIPNDDDDYYNNNEEDSKQHETTTITSTQEGNTYSSLISSKERECQIISSSTKVLKAVKNLPGLQQCTIGDVLEGLQIYSNSDGNIDQSTFPNLLEYLRRQQRTSTTQIIKPSHIKFLLKVNLIESDKLSHHTIVSPSSLYALGLSMRYKIPLNIDSKCFTSTKDKTTFNASDILIKFPQFRPLQELREDAAIIDGFIPSMFVKATLDNDDKV